jgi:nitrate reductase cytochrome c-type subunit
MMKYPILALALVILMLTACGEPKPGQKPPSLYKEREGLLSDSELDAARKQAAETAKKVYPADDPVVPHAKSDEELTTEKAKGTSDDSAAPHDTDEEHSEEEAEKSDSADDSAAPRKGY